ncbi:hypothetical protein F5Y19DRAFT_448943, partial [Xylariaceae sp. FL1651]
MIKPNSKRALKNDGLNVEVPLSDSEGRPKIDQSDTEPEFRLDDQVYIRLAQAPTREGPYIVSSVKDGKYTLCDEKGNAVQDGNKFEGKDLELRNST